MKLYGAHKEGGKRKILGNSIFREENSCARRGYSLANTITQSFTTKEDLITCGQISQQNNYIELPFNTTTLFRKLLIL